jgi:hypothetical protein
LHILLRPNSLIYAGKDLFDFFIEVVSRSMLTWSQSAGQHWSGQQVVNAGLVRWLSSGLVKRWSMMVWSGGSALVLSGGSALVWSTVSWSTLVWSKVSWSTVCWSMLVWSGVSELVWSGVSELVWLTGQHWSGRLVNVSLFYSQLVNTNLVDGQLVSQLVWSMVRWSG